MIAELKKNEIIISLNNAEFETLKMIIESTLKFWSTCKDELQEFPWELFDEDLKDKVLALDKKFLGHLNAIGIETYGMEEKIGGS